MKKEYAFGVLGSFLSGSVAMKKTHLEPVADDPTLRRVGQTTLNRDELRQRGIISDIREDDWIPPENSPDSVVAGWFAPRRKRNK